VIALSEYDMQMLESIKRLGSLKLLKLEVPVGNVDERFKPFE